MLRKLINESRDPYKYMSGGAEMVERKVLSHVYIMMTYPIFAQEPWANKQGIVGNSVKVPVNTIDKYFEENQIQPQDISEDDLKNVTKELAKACPDSIKDKNATLDQLKKSLEITLKMIKSKAAVKRLFNACDDMMGMASDKEGYPKLQQAGGPEVKGIDVISESYKVNESLNVHDFQLKKSDLSGNHVYCGIFNGPGSSDFKYCGISIWDDGTKYFLNDPDEAEEWFNSINDFEKLAGLMNSGLWEETPDGWKPDNYKYIEVCNNSSALFDEVNY